MSDWLKLIECKYTPSQLFTIFDYTKLVYPIDGGFYLKQIVTLEQKPSFIDIKHDYDKIIAVHATPNNVVTLEKTADYYYVCFYAPTIFEQRIRISISLEGSNFNFKSFCSENMLMICCTASDQVSHQIIFIDCTEKIIVARGFVQEQIFDIALGPNCSLSLFMHKHIVAYKNEPMLDRDTVVRIYKEAEADISVDVERHFWIQDELIVWGKNKGYLIIKNKVCQQFSNFHRLHNASPLVCGFLACDGCVIKIFKKKNIRYDLLCEIVDQNLMQCKNITLSPQEDIFVYYTPVIQTLVVSSTFSEQVQQALSRQNSLQLALTLKSRYVSHQKSYDFTIYSSNQSWFAAVFGTQINLLNSHNYERFLTINLINEGESNVTSADLKARHLAIHPNRTIFAVSLRKCIRVYYVTFNQVKILKQIPISMCGYLVFNHSGSILTAVVTGKGGAKLYIYKINEFKSEFVLLETITIGKKPINVEWDSLDTCLYCFYASGYFIFTLQSKFKNRKQISLSLTFPATGAVLSRQDCPIIWGGKNLAEIVNDLPAQVQVIKQTEIKQIFLQGQYYFIVFENGKIGRSKNLDLDTCYIKSFDLGTKGKIFQIRLQQDNKFIYLSEDLNVKFYQFGTSHNGFTDIIGIEKKKLYAIMDKHKHYQQQIKNIKEEFGTVLLEFKANSALEQKKIENEYKYQLKDHVQRQKKVKEEKSKLQEMMEKNIEVKQKQSMKQIKQLERLYERKIALTTNKLLTEKQIGFRDKMTAQSNLKNLEHKFEEQVEQIRKKFSDDLSLQILDKNQAQKQINAIKKHYETRLYELEQQNQILLKGLQEKNENSLICLKKMVNNWQNKYSECISQKDNIEKQYQEQVLNCQILKQKISFLDVRRIQSQRRCENLSNEIVKIEKVLEDRNKILQLYEKRIQDLQKSNEIMKYRVLQVKQQNDPYEQEISKLKQNLTDLQEQYDKILKSSHDQEQKMQLYKKQKSKLKQDLEVSTQKFTKLSKRHEQLLDKVRETTKSPIQQIRRQLLAIIDSYARVNKSYSTIQKRADSPLGQLNRIRDHLEVCLDEAVTSNKKNDEQRKIEVTKKNRENSELLIEINTMRKKIRELQDQIRQKNLRISRLMRGETPTVSGKQQKERVETTEAQSKDFMKTKSRQTFYQKNMFRSGNHWNKRLKTEEGGRRKKSSLSMMRDRHNNSLAIHPQTEEIDEYKRIIEQKDIFIQKLIAKIQKS